MLDSASGFFTNYSPEQLFMAQFTGIAWVLLHHYIGWDKEGAQER